MDHTPFPPDATSPPESKFPWPLVAFGIAAALLVITIWLTPRTDKAASKIINQASETGSQVRIDSVRIAPEQLNNAANVDVYGEATNTGTRPVNRVVVSAMFHNKDGKAFMAQQEPMQRVDVKGDKIVGTEDLAQEPLKPGQSTPFRVSYTQVPGNWDHKPPQLSVLQVAVQK